MTTQAITQKTIDLTLKLPERLFLLFKKDKQGVGMYFKQQTALNQYKKGELSFGQAAELAEMSKVDFLKFLSENKVSVFNYSEEDLDDELKSL